MIERIVALISDPVWWLVTIVLTIALNLLSAVLYDMMKEPIQRHRANKMASKVIGKASYDSSATWLAMNPSAFAYLRKQSIAEIVNGTSILLMGIGAYFMAGVEFNWHRLGNNPSLAATFIYLGNAILGTLAAMVVIRLHLRTRRLLDSAAKLLADKT